MGLFLRNLSILLWKNFKLKLRSPCKTVCEVIVPTILIIIIMMLILLLALYLHDIPVQLPPDPRRDLINSSIT
ncbi:hypothetical protein L9F63_027821, partial [Diploptera punctata]